MADDEDDMEVEKPPERRAPSGRASKGNRMGRLIQEEEEEEGDNDFYQQEFWAEAENDAEYDAADEGDAGVDSFDSDFGDSTESDDDDDDDEAEKKAKKHDKAAARKKSVYKDPKEKKAAGGASSAAAAEKKSHKRQRSEVDSLDGGGSSFARGSLRASTQVPGERTGCRGGRGRRVRGALSG